MYEITDAWRTSPWLWKRTLADFKASLDSLGLAEYEIVTPAVRCTGSDDKIRTWVRVNGRGARWGTPAEVAGGA